MRPSGSRFKAPTSDEAMATFCKGYVPLNMQKNTAWAVKVFSEWRAERNSISSEKLCPANLLDNPDVQELNYWLSCFVTEVRKKDGQPNPPRTIQQILAGLQRRMLEGHPEVLKFMDSQQACFCDLHHTCDTMYRDLHSQGIGTEVRHAHAFLPEDESKLWKVECLVVPHRKAFNVLFFITLVNVSAFAVDKSSAS